MQEKLNIAVFVDYDNIEIGVKSTLRREFDVSLPLDALKERGDLVAKFAYANWGRQEGAARSMAENAVQMVQRLPSPRGDKNGGDINLALDALEMAFTHPHVNAFAIVSGDSDFIPLVNKLKEYGKTVFVVGGKAFTSTILQQNCHEFVSYESLLSEDRGSSPRASAAPARAARGAAAARDNRPQGGQRSRPAPLDLAQAMPLVERALQVLERRAVQPQLGLLKSTMLQLDSAFTEKAYGANSFSDFVEKLKKADYVNVSGQGGRYIIERKGASQPERPTPKPEEALPPLRDVLETHRLEMENGVLLDDLAGLGANRGSELLRRGIRIPGIFRVPQLRAGQAGGARGAGRREGPHRVHGRRVLSARGAGETAGAARRRGRGREAAHRRRPAFAAGAESSAGETQAGAPGTEARGRAIPPTGRVAAGAGRARNVRQSITGRCSRTPGRRLAEFLAAYGWPEFKGTRGMVAYSKEFRVFLYSLSLASRLGRPSALPPRRIRRRPPRETSSALRCRPGCTRRSLRPESPGSPRLLHAR